MGDDILRVQLSLVLSDAEVFYKLITPRKEAKQLNPLVIKLLTAYYYNTNVRGLVDGYNPQSIDGDDSFTLNENSEVAENYKSARDALAMMSLLTNMASDTLANGVDDILGKVNDIADSSGGIKSYKTDFGMAIPKINTKNLITEIDTLEENNTEDKVVEPTKLYEFEKKLDNHDKLLEDISATLSNISIMLGVSNSNQRDDSKNSSTQSSNEYSSTEQSSNLKINNNIEDTENTMKVVNESMSQNPIFTEVNPSELRASEDANKLVDKINGNPVFSEKATDLESIVNSNAPHLQSPVLEVAPVSQNAVETSNTLHIIQKPNLNEQTPIAPSISVTEEVVQPTKTEEEDGTASLMKFMQKGIGKSIQFTQSE